MKEKQKIRETIWKKMRTQEIERFPYAWGRIPNFEGAGKAAARLTKLREYREAPVIFVAPDAPQKPVRMQALLDGKTVVMPTPRLKSGFLVISPQKGKEKHAASIKGAFTYGKKVPVERIPLITLVVQGAVAVDRSGNRVGKGGGYGDREIALLQKYEKIPQAQIAVSVHDVQVVEFIPQDRWDFTVDIIVTPTRILQTEATRQKVISKYMSYILRHHPPENISEDGFIALDEFMELLQSRYTVSKEDILSIVSRDTKGRFQVEGEKIRALYGHSYPVSIEFPSADVDVLYHGTSPEAARQIIQEGLNSRGRQKVHLSLTPQSAWEVGLRHCNNPVILKINTRKALNQGLIIEKASKSVYVADHIPPEYITFYR